MLQRYLQEGRVEAGCDEAGRGCLAGPVTAAAVILPPDFSNELLNDSKQLTEHQRDTLRPIIEREALAWAVAMVSPQEIDTINILRASFIAMHRALDQLTVRPEHILVDGNRFIPYSDIPFTTIIKGDGKMMSIAAASVLAKTHRDEYMRRIALEYPHYGWEKNKGYPTRDHRAAIVAHGISPYHRKSFNLVGQLSLFD
ncbi:MAG: ribonuclease HII [Muribaculaceae bacterium]|nr:ribonuclease HII [Muribaculaceae bacterium]MBQ5508600.1 ribonuclease HII [Muribaculaceae bacterium]